MKSLAPFHTMLLAAALLMPAFGDEPIRDWFARPGAANP